MVSMSVKGLGNLDKVLGQLGKQAGGRALVAALKDSLAPVETDLLNNVPSDTGGMASRIKKRSRKNKGNATVSIGTAKQDYHAAMAAEFGTKNQTPKPFIRFSLDNNWRKCASIVQYALKKRIAQQVKRLAKQKLKG